MIQDFFELYELRDEWEMEVKILETVLNSCNTSYIYNQDCDCNRILRLLHDLDVVVGWYDAAD